MTKPSPIDDGGLPPFTVKAKCPKCAAVDIRAKYQTYYVKRPALAFGRWIPCEPKMLRTCSDCGYSWFEKPLDETRILNDALAERKRKRKPE